MRLDPWTLALQAANFLVLVWLLRHFLYKPVLAVIARRREAAAKLAADAAADRAEAGSERQALERARGELEKQRQSVVAAARASAEAERKAILAKAREDADALRVAAAAELEQEKAEAARDAGRDAARLAGAIVRRLLQDAPAEKIQARMLDLVCRDVEALDADARQEMAGRASAAPAGVEVVTAAPLEPAEAQAFGARLEQALGAPATPAFRVDAGLIAGVEVRFPFTVLRRSWNEDLKRIEAELDHDDHVATVA